MLQRIKRTRICEPRGADTQRRESHGWMVDWGPARSMPRGVTRGGFVVVQLPELSAFLLAVRDQRSNVFDAPLGIVNSAS
jgi:hypothetical protein